MLNPELINITFIVLHITAFFMILSNSTSFKELARQHQIKFREDVLKVGYDSIETILKDEDAQQGLIFYDGFKINEYAQAKYPHFKLKQGLYSNLLRSEHIPFNFFVPLSKNTEYARAVLNRFLGGGFINIITEIKIEHAPDPAKALLDKASFNVFIEYRHTSGGLGIIGIEVKYTERESRLTRNSKEAQDINNPESIYNKLTEKIGLYRKEILHELKNDEYREVWINQLLGESMTRKNHPDSRYEYFTSIILYPEGNDHFRELIPKYQRLLNSGHETSFKGITYEEFIDTAKNHTEDPDFIKWLQYLEFRYIVH
jgi:hypothetical protein